MKNYAQIVGMMIMQERDLYQFKLMKMGNMKKDRVLTVTGTIGKIRHTVINVMAQECFASRSFISEP